jgi:signal transduction histidine kinase
MKWNPNWKSFRTRLIIGAVVWITVGVAVSGYALSELFRVHVTEQFDGELHGHRAELAGLAIVEATGQPGVMHRLSDPRFLPKGSGFYWQLETADGQIMASPSLGAHRLTLPQQPPQPGIERHSFVQGPTGKVRLVDSIAEVSGSSRPVRVAIGSDERLLEAVLQRFNQTLFLSMSIMALGLIGAAIAQVTFGLRPLVSLRRALTAVRSGEAARLEGDLPSEVEPLVHDLNALLDANHEMIRRARTQAGNLAHGLKTPLAILADEGRRLSESGHTEAGQTVLAQCDRMRRQIDYQMARARAVAAHNSPAVASDVIQVLKPILSAMDRLYQARGIRFVLADSGGSPLRVACDPQDLSEMLGNLLDNAGKWAAHKVQVEAVRVDGRVRIIIDDDGPGLPPESWDVVFNIGERLDERAPGSGLGLAIVRDLSELYRGAAWLDASPTGGLRALLELPAITLD